MYIDTLTLFIVAEVLVVFIIIAVILFRRSRLLKIMLALLTERRLQRLRQQSEEHKELLALRKAYGKLQVELMQMRREGGQTYAEQVQNRLDDLAGGDQGDKEDDASAQESADDEPLDQEGTHRTRAIRRAFYEFEAARASPLEQDILAAENTLLEQLKIQLGRDPDEEEDELVQSQNAELLARIRELEAVEAEYKALQKEMASAQSQLADQERKLEELKKIDDASRLDPGNVPTAGNDVQDEIYRLKCERFDQAEAINNLKLRLQKLVDDGDANELIAVQQDQIAAQERYIKEAEASIKLLEEELEAAAQKGSTPSAGGKAQDSEHIDKLTAYANEQRASMGDIRDNLKALRAAEKAEERLQLLEQQEQQLSRMERAVQEADTCVSMLEGELSAANERIESLSSAAETAQQNDHFRQQADELESLLNTFLTDSEDMMACINGLEDHNKALREMLLERGVDSGELPTPPPPPTMQNRPN